MRYNVSQLLKEPTGSTRLYDLEETFSGPGRIADKVTGRVEMLRTHQGILLRAELEVGATFTCSRCLTGFPREVRISLEEEYFPVIDINTGRTLSLPDEAEGMTIDKNHVLDLAELLRQSAIADEPMKPLCSADCRGLCQQCGANLNQEQCQCAGPKRDPRWAGLAGLLRQ